MKRTTSTRVKRGAKIARLKTARVRTRLGWFPRIGMNEWGKPQVECPRCHAAATVTRTLDISCFGCGYSTEELAGCG